MGTPIFWGGLTQKKQFVHKHSGCAAQPHTFRRSETSMSISDAIAYQRDIVAVKSRILAALMPCDRETSAAMQVVIAASQVGTNAARLSKQTGLSPECIHSFAKRLRQAKIWKGNSADATEWLDIFYDRQLMTIILAQALVARGLLKRQWTGNAAIYSDQVA